MAHGSHSGAKRTTTEQNWKQNIGDSGSSGTVDLYVRDFGNFTGILTSLEHVLAASAHRTDTTLPLCLIKENKSPCYPNLMPARHPGRRNAFVFLFLTRLKEANVKRSQRPPALSPHGCPGGGGGRRRLLLAPRPRPTLQVYTRR